MRTTLRAALVVLAAAQPLVAQQGARANLLVTPKWLAEHLNDANLVILQVGDKAEYEKTHIPGARYVDLREVAPLDSITKLTLQLPTDESLRGALSRLGISDNSRIIVYAGSDRVTQTTRVILTLDYAGLGAATSLLDGGMPAWTRAGNAVTATPSTDKVGTLTPFKTNPVVTTAEFVRDNVGKRGIAIVDARTPNFYDGTSEGGPTDARRKGHIAGALSIPFSSLFTETNELKSADELTKIFSAAGVKPGDTIVTYCHIGQQATATLFAARTLGYKVMLYDGSFEDWARRGWPIETPPGKPE